MKILGALLELPALPIQPIYLKIGPNWPNRQCCLAGMQLQKGSQDFDFLRLPWVPIILFMVYHFSLSQSAQALQVIHFCFVTKRTQLFHMLYCNKIYQGFVSIIEVRACNTNFRMMHFGPNHQVQLNEMCLFFFSFYPWSKGSERYFVKSYSQLLIFCGKAIHNSTQTHHNNFTSKCLR